MKDIFQSNVGYHSRQSISQFELFLNVFSKAVSIVPHSYF